MEKDAVCNMEVDENTATCRTEHMGKTYYFCGEGCRRTFEENPEKFAKKTSTEGCGCH